MYLTGLYALNTRVAVPKLTSSLAQKSAIRYKAVDSQTPTWLSLYNVETPVVRLEAYDAGIHTTIGGLSRGIYANIGTFTRPDAGSGTLPCKYVLVVGLEPTLEEEDDLNRWYDEEHMDLLAKTPGWIQGRRYKLIGQEQTGTLADKPQAKYLAIHEFEENNFGQSPEFKHATSTEWRERVMAKIVRREARVLQLY
ncbi:hypothetical protein C8R46DRAFT_588843 [Mycena filopes]|nr:hypothetical protein C8R46DRAFT_588843 [Mycena filopes]